MIEFETLEEENQRLRIKIARLTREATPDPNYEDQIANLLNIINQNEFIIDKLQIDNEAKEKRIDSLIADLERLQRRIELYLLEVDENSQRLRHALSMSRR